MKFFKFLLISSIALITLLLGVCGYAGFIEPNLLIVNRLNVKNPNVVTPFKLVFFGDTHMGEFNDTNQLNRIVEKINAENPDLVIFTGDLIGATGDFSADTQEIARILGKIDAPYGKVAVFGNHEYALTHDYDYEALMTSAGFSVLVNDWVTIPALNVRLLGLDDAYRGNPDLSLTDATGDGAFNVLLTHEPDIVDKMDLHAVPLVLAGHTHGGQISLPYLTEQILPANGKKYIKGLYAIGDTGETELFVTKGTGMTKLPFRFMNVPEIVAIEVSP